MMRLIWILFVLSAITACSPNYDLNTPDGFLRVLANNLTQGKVDVLFHHLSEESLKNLTACKKSTQKIRRLLSSYPELFKGYKKQQAQLALGILSQLPDQINEQSILIKLIEDKWAWLQTQKKEEIAEGLNTRYVVSQDPKKQKFTLVVRSGEKVTVTMKNKVWRIHSFDQGISDYEMKLQKNLKTLENNLKEIKYRQQYNLALPSAP